MLVVTALGGNALLKRGEPMTAENQRANVRIACEAPDEPRPAIDIACSTVPGCVSDNDPACSTLLRRLCVLRRVDARTDPEARRERYDVGGRHRPRSQLHTARA